MWYDIQVAKRGDKSALKETAIKNKFLAKSCWQIETNMVWCSSCSTKELQWKKKYFKKVHKSYWQVITDVIEW